LRGREIAKVEIEDAEGGSTVMVEGHTQASFAASDFFIVGFRASFVVWYY